MNFNLYKTTNGVPYLNEIITNMIVTYCLTQMGNNDLTYENWFVGISEEDIEKGESYKIWVCGSHLEALHTKIYLTNHKNMKDDNMEINGDEYNIYVYHN